MGSPQPAIWNTVTSDYRLALPVNAGGGEQLPMAYCSEQSRALSACCRLMVLWPKGCLAV